MPSNQFSSLTPFIITPISAYLNENKSSKFILPKNKNVAIYLDHISFPNGIPVKDFKKMNTCSTNKREFLKLFSFY